MNSNFERLKEEQLKFLENCHLKIEKWEKFANDYRTLKNRIETLPHNLKYDVMVPISKFGFMPGKLVRTNEILVLLGENWFAEKSAKQACDLIDRRQLNIETQLKELRKERRALEDQLNWTQNLLHEKNECINIEEKLEEDEEQSEQQKNPKAAVAAKTATKISESELKELRRKQQEKALQTVMELEKLRKEQENNKSSKDDEPEEDEEDEEEEEEEKKGNKEIKSDDQLSMMIDSYSKNVNRENNEAITRLINQKLNKPPNDESSKSNKMVRFIDKDQKDSDDDDDDSVSDSDEDLTDFDDHDSESSNESNNGEEEVKSKNKTIKIKHTTFVTNEPKLYSTLSNSSQVKINSPADIYRVFYKPKSILKSDSTQNILINQSDSSQCQSKSSNEEQNPPIRNENFHPEKAFTGQIVEKTFKSNENKDDTKSKSIGEDEEPKKTVSKFRANKKS